MGDKQNSRSEPDELLPVHEEESTLEKSETPRSYYYDDATGYEIYEDEDQTETEEPIGSAEDDSEP